MPDYDLHVVCLLADHFWMREHLVHSWKRLVSDCEVYFYPWESWDAADWPARRDAAGRDLLAWLAAQHARRPVDLVFSVVYDDFMTPQLAEAIRRIGVQKMVNYNVDMQHQWYRVLRSAPHMDLVCGAQHEYLERVARLTEVALLPMAANTDFWRPMDVPRSVDVMFIGGALPERRRALAAAREVTPDVVVYGAGWDAQPTPVSTSAAPGWRQRLRRPPRHRLQKLAGDVRNYLAPRLAAEGPVRMLRARDLPLGRAPVPAYSGEVGGFLPDDAFVRTLSSARVALGINQRFGQVGQPAQADVGYISSRLRDFEVPACGVMYLAQRYPELSIYYDEGREIEGWTTLPEMQRKLDYYLAHDEERERIAQCGRQRVVRSHRWEQRFESVLYRLGLVGPLASGKVERR